MEVWAAVADTNGFPDAPQTVMFAVPGTLTKVAKAAKGPEHHQHGLVGVECILCEEQCQPDADLNLNWQAVDEPLGLFGVGEVFDLPTVLFDVFHHFHPHHRLVLPLGRPFGVELQDSFD
jgi:hypothetical protein